MKELIKLVLVLTGVSLVSGILLAVTQQYTKEPILSAERKQLYESLGLVLPSGDGDPQVVTLTNEGQAVTFYVTTKNGTMAGVAFSSVSLNGYAGPVEALIGLKPDGTLNGLEIKQNETPGLGSKVAQSPFKSQFIGKSFDAAWKVKKDGGTVDAVSGATISSRAVCEALSEAVAVYNACKPALEKAIQEAP